MLFISVVSHGGYDAVCAGKFWPQVYIDLALPPLKRAHAKRHMVPAATMDGILASEPAEAESDDGFASAEDESDVGEDGTAGQAPTATTDTTHGEKCSILSQICLALCACERPLQSIWVFALSAHVLLSDYL